MLRNCILRGLSGDVYSLVFARLFHIVQFLLGLCSLVFWVLFAGVFNFLLGELFQRDGYLAVMDISPGNYR